MSLRWSSYVAPKSPKGGLKNANGLCPSKIALRLKKVSHIRQLLCIRPYLDHKTASTTATSIVHSKRDYCNSLYYNLPDTLYSTKPSSTHRLQHFLSARAFIRPQSLPISTLLSNPCTITIKFFLSRTKSYLQFHIILSLFSPIVALVS